MHELGITQEIIDIASAKADGARVRRLVIEIGKLSAVLPDAVRFAFEICREGTPLAEQQPLDPFTMVRMIAAARILMPSSRVRLSAGRRSLSREAVALCFLAGANSIFVGDKLLTTPNPERNEDDQLLHDLGLRAASHGPAVS